MKRKLLFILSLLLVMPTVVSASTSASTEITSNTQGIGAHTDAKTEVENQLKLNGSIKNVTNGYYAEGLEIKCSNSKWTYTIMNDSIDSSLTCSNGNTNPYKNIVSDGTAGKSITNGGTCGGTESVLYASRIYNYDCKYVGSTPDNKTEYTTTTTSSTTTANSGTNKDGDTTTKATGTTDNKETGVEDYFIALGTIGIAVTALLYIIDKKNVFKKI